MQTFNGNFCTFCKLNFPQWKKSLFLQMKVLPMYYIVLYLEFPTRSGFAKYDRYDSILVITNVVISNGEHDFELQIR